MEPRTAEIRPAAMSACDIADTYLEAIRSKDLRKALFHADVTLQFPLIQSKVVGREDVINYLLSLLPGIDDVRLERHIADGEYVVTLWQALTVWGQLPICSVFRIADGVIREVRSFWDPRPVVKT